MQCTHYRWTECKTKTQKENFFFPPTQQKIKKDVMEQKYVVLKRGATAGWIQKKEVWIFVKDSTFLPPGLWVALDLEKWSKKYLIMKKISLWFVVLLPITTQTASFVPVSTQTLPRQSVHPIQRLVQIQFREKQDNIAPDKQRGYCNCQIHLHCSGWYNLTQGPEPIINICSSLPSLFQLSLFQILWTGIPDSTKLCLRAEK